MVQEYGVDQQALEIYSHTQSSLVQIYIFQEDVAPNCEKMSGHIDFVENVYENVKNPLGYLCNKVGSFIGKNESYTLDNVKSTKPQLTDLENKQAEEEYETSSESAISYESE